jgi:uncharacterized protein VirK/YbjX
VFIVPIIQLARDRYYWSPPRLARALRGLLTNLQGQCEIFKLMALPEFRRMASVDPHVPFKYLSRDYLARCLSVSERASCFMHHYSYLHRKFPSKLLRQTMQRDVRVFELKVDGHVYVVSMALSRKESREGELSLTLEVDGAEVYVLQFTVVPGWVVKSGAADVLLITRLQGIKGCYPQIHQATKAFREVAPPALLLSVLQGIAKACNINELAGVCARSQFSYNECSLSAFSEAYDEIFTQLGAGRSSADYYSCSLPLPEKPVDHIKNGHRSRTKKKRAFKLEIADRVCQLIAERCSTGS